MTHPTGWPTAQSICDIPEVHEALDAFSHDSTEDNAVGLICAVLNHSPASVRAAALEKARDALEEIALAGMSGSGQESPEGLRDWHARRAWEFIGIAARAKTEIDAALSTAPAGGLGDGWMPIETAPKDGTTIVVGFGRQGNFPVKIVRWNKLREMWMHYGEWEPGLEKNATHWMPLPPAPIAAAQGEGK